MVSAARKRCSKLDPVQVLELRLHHGPEVARRVVAELDDPARILLEHDDHAAANLGRAESHDEHLRGVSDS